MTKFSIEHATAVFVLLICLIIGGLLSYSRLPKEAAPDIAIPILIVSTPYFGVSPADIETLVTQPLEKEFKGLRGIKKMTSTSVESVSLVTIEFETSVDIDDAPRTHRTVFAVPFEGSGVGSDLRRDFDQDRFLTYGRYERDAVAVDDWSIQATLSYQRQEEVRNRITSSSARRARGFDAQTYGLLRKGVRETSFGRLTTGAEWYRDHVDSFQNRFAAQTPVLDIQGPVADDAMYDLGGAYADLAFDVTDSTTLTAGARFTYAAADANEVLDPETDTQISIDDSWTALTGSLRLDVRRRS